MLIISWLLVNYCKKYSTTFSLLKWREITRFPRLMTWIIISWKLIEPRCQRTYCFQLNWRRTPFFCGSDFDLQWWRPEGLVNGLRSASGSSLTDGDRKTDTKGLIRAPQHCKSKIVPPKILKNIWSNRILSIKYRIADIF